MNKFVENVQIFPSAVNLINNWKFQSQARSSIDLFSTDFCCCLVVSPFLKKDDTMDIAATYNDCFYVLRRTTVPKGYVSPVLLSSVVFLSKVLTLFTCNNESEKSTGVNENEHTC